MEIVTLANGQKMIRRFIGCTEILEPFNEVDLQKMEEERILALLSPSPEEVAKAERVIETITLLQEVGLL